MNRAIHSFGTEVVVEHIYQFYNSYKLPIVSVGSGTGQIEYLSKQKHPEIEWICVDPNPTNFLPNKEIILKPDYDYVEDLVQQKPEIVSSCILFLNWCYPQMDYDYESIQQLSPLGILSVYAYTYNKEDTEYNKQISIAGGKKFIHWLNNQSIYEDVHESGLTYWNDFNHYELDNMSILWLNDKMYPTPNAKLDFEYSSQKEAVEKSCIIC